MENDLKVLIEEMIDAGWIERTKHPLHPLWILNYTRKCQYESIWNEATMMCRGLIVDADWNIIARPFKKFFNFEELSPEQIPNRPFTVTDKMDGSLGILYWIDGAPYIATRGSFVSDQALHATRILSNRYWPLFHSLPKNITFLFEIIYPQNRIVLDYGKEDDLFLIGIIDTQTGMEYPITGEFNPGFRTPIIYDGITDFRKLRDLFSGEGKEGFVVRFDNGFRVKMKFAEYARLHRIITNVTSYTIYEYLRDDLDINELLDAVPDEFYTWVRKTINEISSAFIQFENKCFVDYHSVNKTLSRKEIAEEFKKLPNTGILFLMLDKKDHSQEIWKRVKPAYSKPFVNGDEE